MATKEFSKDQLIISDGQPLDSIMIIAAGSVQADFCGGSMTLRKGDVIGLCDISFDSHFFTYKALEPTTVVVFPLKDKASLQAVARSNPEVAKMMYNSMINQVYLFFANYAKSKEAAKNTRKFLSFYYERYVSLSSKNNVISRSLPGFDDFGELVIDEDVAEWVLPYYLTVREFSVDIKAAHASKIGYLTGFLYRASLDVHSALSVCEQLLEYRTDGVNLLLQSSRLDLVDLYSSLFFKLPPGEKDSDSVKSTIDEICAFVSNQYLVPEELITERMAEFREKAGRLLSSGASANEETANSYLTDSIDKILAYSGVDDETANTFKKLISEYKKLPDKASSDDPVRRLRLEITKLFYRIYEEAFPVSLSDDNIPSVVKMFFNFGYVDEELAGIENANYLYSIVENYKGDKEHGIYTVYEWLCAIFRKEKEPSRNEFDTDYTAHLHELRIQGRIDAAQEARMVDDAAQRVVFELENMFPIVNKVTFGRLTSFCPVFSEHDIIKPLPNCIVTTTDILECVKRLEAIDYSAYYRETIYTNPACGISKEAINIRITPDFILMPNIGTRGVMWQEIEGKKRTTPSRFMLSAFHIEDLQTTIVRLTGEYRWEMCKRIQGGRWNDVSDKSLTSEYFDYVQFYKKNSELSADAKEKIKLSLMKAKNSFKEMFVRDYISWVMFEGHGSPRLNKLVRVMMSVYCPFNKELRGKLIVNPMYKEMLEKYEIRIAQKIHHFDNVITKLKSSGQDIPDELLAERAFISGEVAN